MAGPTVTMRLYCHGLGDCHLVRLPVARGAKPFWMLIDCGIHTSAAGGAQRMDAVVADIAAVTKGHLDVIVGTHEHWDHLSAFLTAAEAFSAMTIGEIWFSWAENPADPDARAFDRYKGDAIAALAGMRAALAEDHGMAGAVAGLDAQLGFHFGAKGERVRAAREALRRLAPVRYLEPGTLAPLPARVKGVRSFVLGPPRQAELLGMENRKGETYGLALSDHGDLAPMASALARNEGRLSVTDDPAAPFDSREGLPFDALRNGRDCGGSGDFLHWVLDHYFDDADFADRRRIDSAWLGTAPELALQLDNRTNNSSLVLAFELVASGKVLLFAADAQVGNWLSWQALRFDLAAGPVTANDLLSRTIFYKVGHHGSHNATLNDKGLEMMDESQLVAFNPTDLALASRIGWKDFPAAALIARLRMRTGGRLIQSDDPWIAAEGPIPVKRGGALKAIARRPGPSVELKIG